ncbi:hypothetical protein ACU4GD_23670 [Cupriavidus basilensis]
MSETATALPAFSAVVLAAGMSSRMRDRAAAAGGRATAVRRTVCAVLAAGPARACRGDHGLPRGRAGDRSA